MGKFVNKRMKKFSAEEFYRYGEGDANSNIDDDFQK